VLSCRDRASFCSSIWSSWAMAPSDIHLVAENGVVGAHVGMILSQSRQLANIVKTLPYTTEPIHVVLTGVSIKAVTAAKDLICTGSCVLNEAMIPEVLQTVGILGIEVSGDSFCFENGAIIIPYLNRPTSGVDGEAIDGDVRGGQKKTCAADFIKTEDKSEDAESSCIEDAYLSTPRRLKKPKVAYHEISGKNTKAKDVFQVKEVAPQMKMKKKKQKKELKKMIKEKRPTIPLRAAPIEEKIIDMKDCVKMLSQPNEAVPQKKHPLPLGMTPQCELCSKKFREMEDLNNHTKAVHEKRGQYKCNLCSKMFVKKKDIEQQVGSVRPNKTLHECEQCLRKRFNEEHNSAEQPKSEPSKKRKYGLKGMNYVCDQCNINFARSSALKAHKMSKHKKHKMQMHLHTSKLP